MIFNINSTRGQNAGPHVRSTGNLSSIHKADYNAHTKPLFYASNVLNIHYTYLLEVAKFMHDFTRRKLPTPLLNFFSSNLTVHQHNTRQVLDPHFSIIYLLQKNLLFIGDQGFGPTFLSL